MKPAYRSGKKLLTLTISYAMIIATLSDSLQKNVKCQVKCTLGILFERIIPEIYVKKTGGIMYQDVVVLCASSAYEKKYYLNEDFEGLPQGIKDELKIMCVLFTEDVGGVLTLSFEEDGTLMLQTEAEEGDLLYDEIGSVLKVKRLQEEKRELLESLELYFRVFFLDEDAAELLKED